MDTSNKTDFELVKLSIEDSQNFYFLAKRYESKLLRYIHRLTRVSSHDAEDILQEVLIKTFKNLNSIDKDFKFSSWIYRVCHNQVIDYYKKNKKHELDISIEEKELGHILQSSLHLEGQIKDEQTIEEIRNAINKLPNKYKEVLVLRYIEDLDYKEISDVLKKSVGTVSTLISRAKVQFKEIAIKSNLNN